MSLTLDAQLAALDADHAQRMAALPDMLRQKEARFAEIDRYYAARKICLDADYRRGMWRFLGVCVLGAGLYVALMGYLSQKIDQRKAACAIACAPTVGVLIDSDCYCNTALRTPEGKP